jgi:diguanylate cyclase (GGDEF)-like protein
MQHLLRKTDILCRLGGEEFVALCKRADKASSVEIAEKLRQAIENMPIHVCGQHVSVTISVGIATMGPNDVEETADTWYRHADLAVYHSKTHGRNRVTHYHDIESPANERETTANAST